MASARSRSAGVAAKTGSRASVTGRFSSRIGTTAADGTSNTAMFSEHLLGYGSALDGLTAGYVSPAVAGTSLAKLGLTATGDGLAGQTLSIAATGGGTATSLTFGLGTNQI